MGPGMTFTGFITYSVALAIAAAIPGPGIAALVARALGSGARGAAPMAAGLILGDITYLSAAVLGMALIAQAFGMAFLVVKWLGVAYLGWLAWNFWRHGVKVERVEATGGRRDAWESFLAGLVVTLGNPKVMVFYLALTPTLIDLRTVTVVDFLILVVLTAVILTVVLTPYLALASRARRFLATPRGLRALSRVAASFMAGAAVAIAIRS